MAPAQAGRAALEVSNCPHKRQLGPILSGDNGACACARGSRMVACSLRVRVKGAWTLCPTKDASTTAAPRHFLSRHDDHGRTDNCHPNTPILPSECSYTRLCGQCQLHRRAACPVWKSAESQHLHPVVARLEMEPPTHHG